MSVLFVPVGIISELLYFRDYWLPQSVASFTIAGVPVLLEDVLFGFAIGGIAAVVAKHCSVADCVSAVRSHIAVFTLVTVAVMAALWFAGMNHLPPPPVRCSPRCILS
jgi:hypothetical protein